MLVVAAIKFLPSSRQYISEFPNSWKKHYEPVDSLIEYKLFMMFILKKPPELETCSNLGGLKSNLLLQ